MPPTAPAPVPAPPHLDITHLGLLAGEGQFPLLIARAARDRGISVTAIGVRDITSPELEAEVDVMRWIKFGQFGKVIDLCQAAGVQQAMMVGRIKHQSIFQLRHIDLRTLRMLRRAPSKKADALLATVIDELSRAGIEIIDSTLLLRDCMPGPGVLTTACPPDDDLLRDIEFGRPLADAVAGLDIGQTIVVKDLSVVAVEAMEGTDATITRAGEVAGPGCVVLKVAKPRQDKRFDVPVMGLTTIRKLIAARCRAIALPPHSVLFFEQAEAIALAEQHALTIVVWEK